MRVSDLEEGLALAAVDVDASAGDEAGPLRSKECYQVANRLRSTESTRRQVPLDKLIDHFRRI